MHDKRTVCEIFICGKWYQIKVGDLRGYDDYNDVLRRCPECKAQIRLMREGSDGQKAHFEHVTRNSNCSESIAFGNHAEYGENVHVYIEPIQNALNDSYIHKVLLDSVLRSEIIFREADGNTELHEVARNIDTNGIIPTGQEKPTGISRTTKVYKRDAAVVSFVLDRADGHCELCEKVAPFSNNSGDPYLEVHHVINLSNDGADTVYNTVAVCPNCHKELHHGINSPELTESLYDKVPQLRAN